MFLRLRYYFKTDRKIRVQDKQEYADQRKKLKNLDDILEYRCEEITFPFDDPAFYSWWGCIKRSTTGAEYYCPGFSFDEPCEHERTCVRGPDNSKFVKARQEYFSQKQLVHDFWRNRMRERVKG